MKSLVVLSGGMDSTVALCEAFVNSDVEAISFNYGSKHNDAEFGRARATCQSMKVPHIRVDLPFINTLFKSDLLKSGGKIPEGHYEAPTMKKTVVPFRNGIMLSIAAGYAESIGAEQVVIGNHFGDHAVYPDCRKAFIEPMQQAIASGTYAEIKLHSPFMEWTKADICTYGHRLGVDFSMTYSCYNGGPVHCGRCSTCVERIEAFVVSETPDPTEYMDREFALKVIKEHEIEKFTGKGRG